MVDSAAGRDHSTEVLFDAKVDRKKREDLFSATNKRRDKLILIIAYIIYELKSSHTERLYLHGWLL